MNKLLTAMLSTLYKKDAEAIKAILEEAGTDEDALTEKIFELDAERVKGFKAKEKERQNDGHKKGFSEALSKFEAKIKAKYDIKDSELEGEELIDHIVELKAPEGKKAQITIDDIKKSPAFIELSNTMQAEAKKVAADWEKKYNEREAQYKKTETMSKVEKKALAVLDELQPVLPEDATVANTQKGWFLKDLAEFDYEEQPDGSFIAKDKEGKPVEDEHGHPRAFADLVKEKATKSFPIPQSQQRSSTGAGKDKKLPPSSGQKPKNVEELSKIVNDPSIDYKDKEKIVKEFREREAAA